MFEGFAFGLRQFQEDEEEPSDTGGGVEPEGAGGAERAVQDGEVIGEDETGDPARRMSEGIDKSIRHMPRNFRSVGRFLHPSCCRSARDRGHIGG